MSDGTKTCLRCAEMLPLGSFSKHRGRPDGLQAYCKVCTRAANRASMRKNQQRKRGEGPTEKRCGACGEVKPVADFYADLRRRDGYYANCRACHYVLTCQWQRRNPDAVVEIARRSYEKHANARRRASREYARANPERVNARHAAWKRENRARAAALENIRRARKMGAAGLATPDQIAARVAYYGWRCWMCGAPWECVDHVKPVAAGGPNWPANLRPACAACNLRKGSRWPFTR